MLQYLAQQDIAWRDCKPENVLCVDGGERIKVIDFGTAKDLSCGWQVAECAGTPQYMSPELVNGEPYGRPSDAWAVGVLLFEMLSLERPFEGTNETVRRWNERDGTDRNSTLG